MEEEAGEGKEGGAENRTNDKRGCSAFRFRRTDENLSIVPLKVSFPLEYKAIGHRHDTLMEAKLQPLPILSNS